MLKKWLLIIMTMMLCVPAFAMDNTTDLHDAYTMQGMVILSRHNIRSPKTGEGTTLAKMTPHQWSKWTSAPTELSLRGGERETIMGQYFRQRLVKEGLITDNYIPKDGEMRFYANSMQRTLATAQYFTSGMLPVANVRIEHKFVPSAMDPVFNPQVTNGSAAFREQAMKEIRAMGGEKGLIGIGEKLQKEYTLLEKVLDFKKSELAKEKNMTAFRTDDLTINLNPNKQPSLSGSMNLAFNASDALILQYYEEPDARKAAFGKKLSDAEWDTVAHVKDAWGDVLFTAPSVATNVAHPLLIELNSELKNKNRKFAFLCGHDPNICSVLAALGVKEYNLPYSIEKKAPIGCKLVIEKWTDKTGDEFARMRLVYQSTKQLRNREMLTNDNPPLFYEIELQDLDKNEYGLYKLQDLVDRFQQAIDANDALPQEQADPVAA